TPVQIKVAFKPPLRGRKGQIDDTKRSIARLHPQPGFFRAEALSGALRRSYTMPAVNDTSTVALDATAIGRSIKRIAHEIAEHLPGAGGLALVGIVRRGARLAERLAEALRD